MKDTNMMNLKDCRYEGNGAFKIADCLTPARIGAHIEELMACNPAYSQLSAEDIAGLEACRARLEG